MWEPSQQLEVLFVDARTRLYGYASASESGWRFRELPLPADPAALVVTLGGDESLRFVAVADPRTRIEYAPDGAAFAPAAALAPGVATRAAEQTQGATDAYRVVAADGTVVARGPVADEVAPSSTGGTGQEAPRNVVGWEPRGTLPDGLLEQARRLYALSREAAPDGVEQDVLFAGDDDAGRRYLLGQFWLPGDDAGRHRRRRAGSAVRARAAAVPAARPGHGRGGPAPVTAAAGRPRASWSSCPAPQAEEVGLLARRDERLPARCPGPPRRGRDLQPARRRRAGGHRPGPRRPARWRRRPSTSSSCSAAGPPAAERAVPPDRP